VRICGAADTRSESRLQKILDFFEIESQTVEAEQLANGDCAALNDMRRCYSVLTSAVGLLEALNPDSVTILRGVLSRAKTVFVFDFDDAPESAKLLGWLTGMRGVAVRRPSDRQVFVARNVTVCGPLSGIVAQPSASDDLRVFLGVQECKGFRSVLGNPEGPVFFECRKWDTRIFLSASGVTLDLDQPPEGYYFDVRSCFCGVVPLLMYLKAAFPEAMPACQKPVGASLIVDDPALRRRYGFLDFENVLTSMEQHDFATTIAFIPWNWRRTDRRVADMFLKNSHRYSLVTHGYDHTAHEFGISSLQILNQKVKSGRCRAERHLRATGVDVRPIMVFPQGVFSRESVHVLKCNNFLAAVNTEVDPFGDPKTRTEVRELWNIAITKYSSFAIFTRRYMSDGIENFAFDALLGKPCLMVAHHEVFKNGGRQLVAFIQSLNSLAGGIEWGSLESVVKHSYCSRKNVNGSECIRMFASEMVLAARPQAPRKVIVQKREVDPAAIRSVTSNQQELDVTWENGLITFQLEVPSRGAAIKVDYFDPLGEISFRERLQYRIGVRARRWLSELRDDYMSRTPLLNESTARVVRLFK
jgi:hypothetical protein